MATASSVDHWRFLDEIEAPMWMDLTLTSHSFYFTFLLLHLIIGTHVIVCFVCSDDDSWWFDTCHEFHQRASSQIISNVFHPRNSINIQEPPSPKLPASVSKSRGKSYKTKDWEQRRVGKTVPNQQQTLTRKSVSGAGSTNKPKPNSNTRKLRGPKPCYSSESGLTENSRPKLSKSPLSSFASGSGTSTITYDHTEPENKKPLEIAGKNSSHTSDLLSSLRMNLRKSYATRPAVRTVARGGRRSEGVFKSFSGTSSMGSPLDQGSLDKKFVLGDSISGTGISQPERNKAKVLNVAKAPALNTRSLPSRQGNSTLASKVKATGKVQQHTSLGKVLMPRKVNEQNQMISKETKKVGVGKRTVSLASIKETVPATTAICQKIKSSDKAAQPTGNVQRAAKQSVAGKNGTKKPVGLKQEKTNRNRDKDTANPARKVYLR